MGLDKELLQSSLTLVVEREPELTVRFYEIFFERYPQVRPMFSRNSSAQQARMLQEALAAVVAHVDDGPWLERTLKGLGARHVRYGVRNEMYDWVGECLLATLAEVAGDDWSDDLAQAWTDAYGAIAGLMQAGAAEAEQNAA